MSVSKFESEVKYVAQSPEAVYARFSDLNNLAALRDRLEEPEVQASLQGQVPADKLAQLRSYVEGMTFTADSLTVASPLGEVTLRLTEREPYKCLKFASEGAPVQLYLWVQMLPHAGGGSKLRVTVGAEVNIFMKGMVAKPLQQAADGLASLLAASAQGSPAPQP